MVKNIAHRGFKSQYPENTMIAFEKAIETKCHGIEFDVHLSKDGEVVIIHDETLEGTTNGTGRVMDYTLQELKELDASHKFHEKVGVQRIPTLREYFELVKDLDFLSNVELKTGVYEYPGLEEKVYALIQEFSLEDKVLISSFNHESLLRMKKIAKEIPCGMLFDTWTIHPEEYVKKQGMECYHPVAYSLRKDVVDALKKEGIKVHAWLGKHPVDYEKVIAMGIDGIITDYPDVISKILAE
ncbi:MAG TPA: glycerophosphodiester phosphodiesterase [Clostridiaceae bacterium]|nr:glycerophosphodiester phosphodiesterase [Clostridiaceae bacterium]